MMSYLIAMAILDNKPQTFYCPNCDCAYALYAYIEDCLRHAGIAYRLVSPLSIQVSDTGVIEFLWVRRDRPVVQFQSWSRDILEGC